jgi:hypothetical protein
MDPHTRILDYLDHRQAAPQLYSRGWVDPDSDPLLLRKSGSAGNRTWDLYIWSQELRPLDHRGGLFSIEVTFILFICIWSLSWSSSCGRQSVDQFVWVSGLPLGPLTRFYLALLSSSDNYLIILSKASSLTRKRVCSLQWNHPLVPITLLYCLIWDCVPFCRLLRLAGTTVEVF